MTSAICTLFARDYHFGLGALTNSLYAHGYRGIIFAGYDGALPPWSKNLDAKTGYSDFNVAEGLTIRFIEMPPKVNHVYYKPDFMLGILREHCPEARAIFFFDPDIIIKCRWTFFEEWVEAGVAVCADVNASMPDNHPIRHAWRRILQPHGLKFRNSFENYFNGGFVGVTVTNVSFLADWQRAQVLVQECGSDTQFKLADRTLPFTCRDQDALNIACMATENPVSPVGQDGMDLQHGGGGYVMSHALGSVKPWNKPFIRTLLLRGVSPSRTDRLFFRYVKFPIRLYPSAVFACKHFLLLTASFLGRFMSRT
jgi:hypothetical protein